MADPTAVKAIADDKAEFNLVGKIARAIPLFATALTKRPANSTDAVTITLPSTIKSSVFRKVLIWVDRHQNNTPQPVHPVPGVRPCAITDPSDAEFLKVDQITLFEIVLAANHLGLTQLVDLCSKVIASAIHSKTADEIRTTFNIRDDWSPEARDAFRLDNQWVYGGDYVSKNPTQIVAGLGIIGSEGPKPAKSNNFPQEKK